MSSEGYRKEILKQVREKRQPRVKPTPEEIEELREIYCQRWHTADKLKIIEEQTGKRFKRGRFSEKEKRIIREGLAQFCRERGLSESQFIQTFFLAKRRGGDTYQDKRFKQVFADVAKKLDGRPILLVYQCMRRMYHPGNLRGRWSEEDDQELLRLFEIHGPDWETIGLSMNRYGMSVRDRYRIFRHNGNSGYWSDAEVERLKMAVQEVRQKTMSPCWLLISERVKTRSPVQCMSKWASLEILQRNKGCRPKWTSSLDYHLIFCIYNLAIEHESEIRWREIADESWPVHFLPKELLLRFRILRKRIRNHQNISMDDLLEALLLDLKPTVDDADDNKDLINETG